MDVKNSPSLKVCFEDMPDPRCEYLCSHKLIDIIMIAICAVIAGSDTWEEIAEFGQDREPWLRGFLELPHGIPSHDTFGRVFALLDPKAFRACFRCWIEGVVEATHGQVIAVDGKTLRRSHNRSLGKEAIHIVSAWATANKLVLGQVKVNDKSNEITAIPELLSLLDIAGCIVTIDAMGCQRAIARQIIEAQADYVLAVKENQPTLHANILGVLGGLSADRSLPEADYAVRVEKNRERIETRHCWVVQDEDFLHYVQRGEKRWLGLRSLVKIQSERIVKGQLSIETRYYISSLGYAAKDMLKAIRAHWGIENGLHWVLDVGFREDECRVRIGHGPENLALLRHIATNTLKQDTTRKTGTHARRLKAARDLDYLARLLGF
jgi:predicted transposase YbfD/YdcC